MRRSQRNLLYLVYIILVAFLVFFIIKAFNTSSTSTGQKHTNKQTSSESKPKPSPAKPSQTSSKPNTRSSAAPPTNSLNNTGPGDTIGLFIGSSLIFGFLHYLNRHYRSRKTEAWGLSPYAKIALSLSKTNITRCAMGRARLQGNVH